MNWKHQSKSTPRILSSFHVAPILSQWHLNTLFNTLFLLIDTIVLHLTFSKGITVLLRSKYICCLSHHLLVCLMEFYSQISDCCLSLRSRIGRKLADAHSLLYLYQRSPVSVGGADPATCKWTMSKTSPPPLCLLLRDACKALSVILPSLPDTSDGMKKAGPDPEGELIRSHGYVLSLHRDDLIQIIPGCCNYFPLFHFSTSLVSFPLILFSYYNLTPISFFCHFFSCCCQHYLSEPLSLLSV